jgi:hypothetical protein
VYPYAHPQHLKVLKHFVYIQHGCGMKLMRVCSLNHDTATSCRLGHTQFSLKLTKTHPPLLHTIAIEKMRTLATYKAFHAARRCRALSTKFLCAREHEGALPTKVPCMEHVWGASAQCVQLCARAMGEFSLNHDTTTSYRLGHTPFS